MVYCGVTDNGEVQGIHLTNYQKDHVLLSVQDLFSRFDPPVDSSMYTVQFVPVVESDFLIIVTRLFRKNITFHQHTVRAK